MSRLLRRRQEPGSIFEHVDAHVQPGVPGLAEGGAALPDDEVFADGEIPFAPGALEGILGGPDDSEFGRAAVEQIYDALVALAAQPSAATRRRLRDRFRAGYVRARIDPLRDRLVESPPEYAERLYPELHEIFLRSGHRDEVKFAMALMSGFRRPGDADLFRVIGRHAEFTLYAAVALATVTDDPLAEWLALLEHVDGWGRTELARLILREPRSRAVHEQLVRRGLGVGNALELAVGCDLDEILARPEIDADVLAGARDIIEALATGEDFPSRLTDYPYAGPAVEALLERISERPRGPGELRAAAAIQSALTDPDDDPRTEDGEDRFEAGGLDEARRARVLALCAELLS
jgi:hypothetical protein